MSEHRGWPMVPVERLAANEPGALTDGPFGSNLKTSHYTSQGPQVIRLQNIGDGSFRSSPAHVSDEHFERLKRHEARFNDVVVAMLGEKLPRACLVPEGLGPAIVKADCVRLRVNPEVANPRFVMYGLNSEVIRKQTADLVHGVGRPRLGLARFRNLEFPLPSLSEQAAVVDTLDSYFSRLDDVEAGLERVQRNLKRYRASVLQAAVTGRLEQDLVEGSREGSACRDGGLPVGWRWSTIGELARVGTGATPRRGVDRYWRGGTIPWVTSAVVNETLVREPSELVTREALGETNLELYPPGSILVAMYGEGRTRGRASELGIAATTNQALAAIVLRDEVAMLKEWVLLVLHFDYQRIRAVASGGVQPNLNLAHVRAIRVPVPPTEDAIRIVTRCQYLLSAGTALEAQAESHRGRLAAVRQALLNQAFSGALA